MSLGARAVGKPATKSEVELFESVERNLYTAVVADVLDQLGQRDRALRENLRPLSQDCTFAGWARTIMCMDVSYIPAEPYAMEIEAVDSILPVWCAT